jgi:hypothetical protein
MDPRISMVTVGVADLDGFRWAVAWNPGFPLED